MKALLGLAAFILLLSCAKEQDEIIVPRVLDNGSVALLKSGKNWPESNFKSETQVLVNHRYPANEQFNLSVVKREQYIDGQYSQYIDRERLGFLFLPPVAKRITFRSADEIRQNHYQGVNLPNASFSIVHEDELHAYYELDSTHDNFIDIITVDQQTEKMKVKFDVKFTFFGSDADWKKAQREFDDVKERSFLVQGEVEVDSFTHFK